MSVILECQPGDELICIQSFHASPDGQGFSWDTSRRFRVGERLRYVGFRQDPGLIENANGWLAVVETPEQIRYAATQTLFVTEECWQGLKKFFARRLWRDPKNVRSKT